MPDLDTALAPLVDDPLAPPEPMAELERRAGRIRRRRRLAGGVAATTAVATVAVVVLVLARPGGQTVRTVRPVDSPPGSPFRGDDVAMVTVARAVVDGQEWRMVAGRDPSTGEFCSGQEVGVAGTQMGVAGTSSCGGEPLSEGGLFAVYPGQYVMGRRPTDPPPPKSVFEGGKAPMIYGEVAKSVSVMRLELEDGRTIDVVVSGSEAGLPVNFYAITVPPDGEPRAVIALDAEGRELAHKEAPLWGPFPPPPCLPPENAQPCSPATDVSGAAGSPPPAPETPPGPGTVTAHEIRERPPDPPG